ncbi:uncharacterized protein [Amphiura filiformis]|uniref:uncharacterized protein n=1 Tax=Amphiura filiformis TaxID=82378 RepID=UPI003B218646
MAYKQRIYRFVAVLALCVQLLERGYAEKIDSLGRKFMFAMPTPYKPTSVTGIYRPTFHILISTPSSRAITGTVNTPGVAWGQSFTVTLARSSNISIPATDYLGYSFSETPRAITIETIGNVAVHVFYSYSNFISEWLVGSTNVMPVDSLGSKYYVASFAPYSSRKSEFTVTAIDDETVVEIETRNGQRYRKVLAPSGTYQLQSDADLTGTVITADKPVSVMSGSGCSKVPSTKDRCNYLVVHLTDVGSAGLNFVISPFKDRTTGYIFRVLATEDNTQLRFGANNNTFEIHAGQFYESDVSDDTVSYISSSAPVLVFKYGKGGDSSNTEGDPIMVIVPAVSHFIPDVTFPVAYLPTRAASKYSLSITIGCSLSDGLLLDGRPLETPLDVLTSPVTSPVSYCIVRIPITEIGIHSVSHTSFALFTVEIHAISYKIGYVYQAGYNIKNRMATSAKVVPNDIPQYLGDDGLGLLCGSNQMTVFVNKSLLTDGEARDVHFTDPTCFGRTVMNDTIIYIIASYTECGTVLAEGDKLSQYQNRLIYEGPRNPGPIMRDPIFNIPVTCSQNNLVLVSLAIAPQSTNINKTLDGDEQLVNITYAFQMFHSKQYNKAYTEEEFPVTVQLDQSLYFEASVMGTPNLKMMTHQCLATASSDPMETPNYIFIDDGCPSDNTVLFYQTNNDVRQRFSIQTFVFLQNKNEALDKAYIHCWLLACNNDSSSRCTPDCSAPDRGQRDTVQQTNQNLRTSEHVYIRQGPIILGQDRGDSSSVRSRMASAVGGTLAVLGIGLLIILLVFFLIKVKQRRGNFSLIGAAKTEDTIQLIDMSPK